jgi:hypothetical protein
MAIDSILIHSDTPGAVALARTVRRTIEAAGHDIRPLSCAYRGSMQNHPNAPEVKT